MKGVVPDPFDPTGSHRQEPGSFAVLAWSALAGFTLLLAVVALLYGAPEVDPPAAPVAQQRTPDPMPTGSIADRFAPIDSVETFPGRSDLTATTGPSGADIARLTIENAALRRTTDVLRGQVSTLSDRITALEDRLSELTGSINRPPPTGQPTPLAEPRDTGIDPDAAEPSQVSRTSFGLELGSYADLAALKAGWKRLSEEQPGLFSDLDALASVRDRGGRAELLLIAGPFPNAADAAQRCERVEQSGIACLPAFYLGQALAVR